jgi:hypothetical protein
MDEKRKRGRPPVIGVTRGHRTEVRLAPAEHAALLALAKAAGMTISDYVRAKVLEAVPR